MDRDLELPALVLLDEIGAGTDPLEGGALGVAIVDRFRTRGALVVGTTHYDVLKTYAATTPGVANAAFAFDPVNFAPTYHLVYGSPGSSLALEMAGRLGLNASIVDEARKRLGTRELELADQLKQVDAEMSRLKEEREALGDERKAAAAARASVEQRARRCWPSGSSVQAEAERSDRGTRPDGDARDRRRRAGAEAADVRARDAGRRRAATVDGRSGIAQGARPRGRRGGGREGARSPRPQGPGVQGPGVQFADG